MMRSLSILIVMLISSFTLPAQTAQTLFDEANDQLTAGNYEEALTAYQAIEQTGEVSGALYLNMGIVATQIDSLGLAKYYFIKASEFNTTQARAAEALEYTESQFSRQSAMLPKLPWEKAVEWLLEGPGVLTIFLTGFSFILIGVLLILLKWFTSFSFQKFNHTLSTVFTTGILILLLSFYIDYVNERYSGAVIIADETQVRNTASETADIVSLAYEGYSVTIDIKKSAEHKNWVYIRLGNGQFGWMKPEALKIL